MTPHGEGDERAVKKILVVEDDSAILSLIQEVLAEEGYHVLSAINGKDGLEQVLNQYPDMVISDLMMPILNGIDMARTLRADPRYQHLPLVAISGALKPDAAMDALFTAFLAKPFSLADLLAVVERTLGNRA
jgi:chemosensory pili system protein ChpA (sensor histidine kinase/response regulator)